MKDRIQRQSTRQAGRVVPSWATWLRAATVVLAPQGVMDWHSTKTREELLIALEGRVQVEMGPARQRRRLSLTNGQCLFLPPYTRHRVINRSGTPSRYLYVTAGRSNGTTAR